MPSSCYNALQRPQIAPGGRSLKKGTLCAPELATHPRAPGVDADLVGVSRPTVIAKIAEFSKERHVSDSAKFRNFEPKIYSHTSVCRIMPAHADAYASWDEQRA